MDNLGRSTPLVPPLYQSSVYCLPDLDALDRVMNGEETGYIYARDGHPNAHRLARRLADMEGAGWAVVCGSGMGAVSAAILAHAQQGDRILASNRLYGRTTQLLMQELTRFGLTATLVDTTDLGRVEEELRAGGVCMLLVETLSNPLLRVADIPALANLARAHDCLLLVDNTFATPGLCRPLERGADLVLESLTKMIGGHSDVTLGVLCGGRPAPSSPLPLGERGGGEGETSDQAAQVAQVVSIWGLSAPPFDCWLTERSLDTLPLRLRAACDNALALAGWLERQPSVRQVTYPGRPDHPDHELSCRLFTTAWAGHELFGTMLCFELSGGRDAVNRFMRNAPGIPFSPSLGHTTTTCSHPASTSHRYVSPAERKRQGIGDGLVRLSVGIEDLDHIQEEMARGL